MENETIIGVHPLDLRGTWAFTCYDIYFTNMRLIANFLESRSMSRFWGHKAIMAGYNLADAAIISLLQRKQKRLHRRTQKLF